ESLSAAEAEVASAATRHKADQRRGSEIRRTNPTVLCARGAVRRTEIPEFSRTVMAGFFMREGGLLSIYRLSSFYLSLLRPVNGRVSKSSEPTHARTGNASVQRIAGPNRLTSADCCV